MDLKIEDFVLDTSLQAKALQEQQGVVTYRIGDIAFVCLSEDGKFLHVRNLFVAKTVRRQGIGTRTFKIIERAAAKAGFVMIGLSIDATRIDPEGSLAFAESLGLKVSEECSGAGQVGLLKFLPLHIVPKLQEPSEPTGIGA